MRRRRVTLPRSVDCHIPLLYLRTFGGWGLLPALSPLFYCFFGTIAFSCLFSVLCIISVVTPLTQGSQIIVRAVFGSVVEVCYRQDDVCVLLCLRIMAVCVVFHSTELAAVVRTLQYPFPYLFPVLRVSGLVLRLYRHFCFCYKGTPRSRVSGVVL